MHRLKSTRKLRFKTHVESGNLRKSKIITDPPTTVRKVYYSRNYPIINALTIP